MLNPYSQEAWDALKAKTLGQIDSEIKKNVAVCPPCTSFGAKMPAVEFKSRSNTTPSMYVNIPVLGTFWFEGNVYIKLSNNEAYQQERGEVHKFGPHNIVKQFTSKIIIEEL